MTEEITEEVTEKKNPQQEIDDNIAAEKISIKSKLDMMSVRYSPNAGINRLRDQLKEALKVPEEPEVPAEVLASVQGITELPPGTSGELLSAAQYLGREANKLHRVIVTCMNPNKKEWAGEYFDVGNSADTPKRKYVLFESEYHVPNIILDYIREKKFQIFVKGIDNKGREIKRSKLVREYTVVDLPPLTLEELKDLQHVQAMRGGQEAA